MIIFIAYECIYEKFYKHTKINYMFNKLTSLEEKTMKLQGFWKILSGVFGFREIPVGASSGQRELAQDLLVLTALGPQFQRAKG